MALKRWMGLWVLGALLLPGFPAMETGLCSSGTVGTGSNRPLSRVLTGKISAPQIETGAMAPEQHHERLSKRVYSDQLLYRRHSVLTRRRRNILFPSGVKLCTQETFDQATANHLTFFQHRGELLPLHFLFFSFLSKKCAFSLNLCFHT